VIRVRVCCAMSVIVLVIMIDSLCVNAVDLVQIAGVMVVVIVAETAMVTYAATLVSIGVIVRQQRRQ